ncbi:MAG: hypothetical protein C0458_05425 [Methylobacterium sp.]|nr:hypothetical protein [Methylobacterium sp.]
MATNQFLPFATAGGANVLTPAQWAGLASRLSGFAAGVAKSNELNTAWRQALAASTLVGRFISEVGDLDALDNGDIDALLANYIATYRSQRPNYTAAVGGTSNALTVTMIPPLTAHTGGLVLRLRADTTNTAAFTLNAGPGVKSVVRYDGTPTQPGDRPPNVISEYVFDDVLDAWRLMILPTPLGGLVIYDTAGSHSLIVPDGVTQADVEVWGGGGGSGACLGLTHNCGGTGGGGGYARKTIKGLIPGSSVSVTVGAGGAKGVASPFAQPTGGGTSSFGAYVSATGGTAGQSASGSLPSLAGSGGIGVGGDINVQGGAGGLYWVGLGGAITYAPPGNAYGNPFRQPGSGDGPGSDATNAGDAGTAGVTSSGGSFNGGAGAPGKVIVRY